MSERIGWLPTVVVAVLLGNPMMPAIARGSAQASFAAQPPPMHMHIPLASPRGHVGARHIITGRAQHDLLRRHAVVRALAPLAIWPYAYPVDTVPGETSGAGDEAVADPHVIILSSSANGFHEQTAAPGVPLDYSYVPGCRAIPNGYHCDTPHEEVPGP